MAAITTQGRVATPSTSAREARERLALLDRALDELDRAQSLLDRAEAVADTDPRAAFELAHRAALRAAGVVIDRANRARRRRLPLNAWQALSRLGATHRDWAREVEPMVAERRRLDGNEGAVPDLDLLARHCRSTRERIAAVRAETVMAHLPEAGAVAAGAR